MLQLLLFLHIVAVALLFTGLGIEIAALLGAKRATTAAQVHAAIGNGRLMGPLMGGSAVLLIVAGIGMVQLGGYGWQPWTLTGLVIHDQRPAQRRDRGPRSAGRRRTDLARARRRAA